MQVNSTTERRIIFSVWDSGGEAVSRGKVSDENRVMLLAKGDPPAPHLAVWDGMFDALGSTKHLATLLSAIERLLGPSWRQTA